MADASTTVQTWGPKRALLFFAAGGGVVFAVLAVLAGDPAGRLLMALAAAGLLVGAATATAARPRLAVDDGGVVVRGITGRRRVPWSELAQWEVVSHHRLGRSVDVLELSVDQRGREVLLLFTALELGADPVDVLAVLQQWRSASDR